MPIEPFHVQPEGVRSGAKSSRRRYLLRGLQVAVGGIVLYFLVAYLARSWESIRAYEWVLRPGWLVLSGLAFLAFYCSQAVAWWLLLRGFGLQSPLTVAVATWAKSILVRYVPGTVFMFVGRA